MIENIVCSFCLCTVLNNTPLNCFKCEDGVTKEAAKRVIEELHEPETFSALNCRPNGTPPRMNFNPGMFVPKGEK